MNLKRKLDVVVISDVHLGTFGCNAKKLLNYLNSIEPKHIVLNGDIIDIWQFKKRYFPKSHLKVIKKIMSFSANGTKVSYVTGNHDEMLRKFTNTQIGNISIVNKLLLDLDGKKTWIFHGDVFDISIQRAKWLAKLGGWGYDFLIVLNRLVNWYLQKRGKERYSFSKKIKSNIKGAVKYISDFEKTASDLAIENNYNYVICGHIHQPSIEVKSNKKGSVTYLNSGDWVENFTALEYRLKRWKLYYYSKDKLLPFAPDEELKEMSVKDLIAAITIVKNEEE
ncbi:UDP-2,3-diacylglucosamine pyrophosphatase LpxH [Winogradskyella wandonensis]|uniref:UDP-2,3-diacylglucosamine pyrophosphatase LpxH n=1 Tax=Winogradskyella wandonensis TaxID=1442586 RepID=A0A4R1KVQ0_9FLAO|nr:UDP-2,3-diacylglucosamine diphosphatase [Winogradskyella wandonensis]TCK69255.1 UDP-2,3-diacylglucosamine pyrophosphatase LpxH [Winogradskyella wandonensis]